MCRCGHPKDYHEHYRAGSDCGFCPCPQYRSIDDPAWKVQARLLAATLVVVPLIARHVLRTRV